MKSKVKLSTTMTLAEFENGYWYATELKKFGEAIGIPSAGKLRKDELETSIRRYLTSGKIQSPKRSLARSGVKDVDLGLRLDLPVVLYTNDKATKDFLEREARKLEPGLKRKSGTRYRHNRWREEQLTRGLRITYEDLVKEYVRLNRTEGPFSKIPQARYINFLSDFLAAEKGATREDAMKAWKKVKVLNVPKTYRGWVMAKDGSRNDR